MEYIFKATDGNRATHGGDYLYRKGRWTRTESPVLCESGWHLARGKQILNWLAPTLWLAEIHPDAAVVEGADKLVASRIRVVERLDGWDERTARLFAADCADDALALIEKPDPRSVEAVAVARRYVNNDATPEELAAARAAAELAAYSARAAAESSAYTAAELAAYSARAAARSAAYSAAYSAAREHQYRRLLGVLGLDEA